MVRNLAERDSVPIVERNKGRVMFVMSPPTHNTPVHCRHPVNAVRWRDVMCGAGSLLPKRDEVVGA
jgi:hypothetical protein